MTTGRAQPVLQPLLLEPARVHREYRGGALLEQWLGDPDPADGARPEAWFGAVNAARATGGSVGMEGIGTVLLPPGWAVDGDASRDGRCSLPALLAAYPELLLGKTHVQQYGQTTAVLLKVLDSATRRTTQIHPDRAFAARHLGSPFGKDETWIVLATRSIGGEAPDAFLGFKEPVEPDRLRDLIATGDVAAIQRHMHRLPLQAGDVYYVPAGTPHAIGPGLLIAEVQEPTDFTFSFDRHLAGKELSDARRFLGLTLDEVLEAVRTSPLDDWALSRLCRARGAESSRSAADTTSLRHPVGAAGEDQFWVDLITVGGDDELCHVAYGTPAVGVVVGGSGTLAGERTGPELPVWQGQGVFLPAGLGAWRALSGGAGLRLVVCGSRPAGYAGARLISMA